MREEREFQKSRTVLQALLNQKGASEKFIMEAFEDLKHAFFPYDKKRQEAGKQQQKEALMREIARGPMVVTPMADPDTKKNRAKLERGQAVLRRRQAMLQHGQLETLDPYEAAKRRPRSAS